ncbi:SDR family oxidoreductase [Flavobacteriales bacterium]|jgi:UDP-N-acetylglucosamine/UDP-N-acetylgalactosamine 4-epimerase|nr:SDR family oxidoreductase [Flavobacteriales bacterium]
MKQDSFFKGTYHNGDLSKCSFLLTGGAGFIGSNIVRYLHENKVGKLIILDNLSNGYLSNIQEYLGENIIFKEGDILDYELINELTSQVDFVIHQAALGSVPRSINTPLITHNANVNGFLNVLECSRLNGVKRFVYASSSSVYGDSKKLPKVESEIGNCLSPYAVSKKVDEEYASVFNKVYGLETIGLRYFNVFGPNQSPNGPYAAVLPLFMDAMLNDKAPTIHGDGGQTRDFTFVENAVQANIRACFTENSDAFGEAYNVAVAERTTILDLFGIIKNYLGLEMNPNFVEPRNGDIRDSLADISKGANLLGYKPNYTFKEGLEYTIDWYKDNIFSMEKI